jgi:hypothetical protein
MDPVNTLLRAWKPERYSRQHLEVLLELVHETMKVHNKSILSLSLSLTLALQLLDIADYCFKKESSEDSSAVAAKKKKKNEAVKEDERSQYLAAALRFDPHEYFRRLICHQTVRLYVRALELYASNSPQVNHHIFVFLQVPLLDCSSLTPVAEDVFLSHRGRQLDQASQCDRFPTRSSEPRPHALQFAGKQPRRSEFCSDSHPGSLHLLSHSQRCYCADRQTSRGSRPDHSSPLLLD